MTQSFDLTELEKALRKLKANEEEALHEIKKVTSKFLLLPNQFLYVIDYRVPKIIHMQGNVELVLGYKPEELDFIKMTQCTHSEDRKQLLSIYVSTFQWARKYKAVPYKNLLNIEYRALHKNGEVLRLGRHLTPLIIADDGTVSMALGVSTDLAMLHSSPFVRFSMEGPNSDKFRVPFERDSKIEETVFNLKEISILMMMAKGMYMDEIATQLDQTLEEINEIRDEMLKQTGAKSNMELLMIGMQRMSSRF